jgi:hypothetical protein
MVLVHLFKLLPRFQFHPWLTLSSHSGIALVCLQPLSPPLLPLFWTANFPQSALHFVRGEMGR